MPQLAQVAIPTKYCLYARKSTESEERQVLSIDLQIKEMLQLAEREGLEIVCMKRDNIQRENKEFAFTKLFTCGYCQSGISAEEKWKQLKDGTHAKYIYYSCARSRDRNCKNKYIREEDLITELLKILDKVNINELGMRQKLEDEIARFNIFQRSVLGATEKLKTNQETDIRNYAKYILKEGAVTEKRELLANLRSRIIYKDKILTLTVE